MRVAIILATLALGITSAQAKSHHRHHYRHYAHHHHHSRHYASYHDGRPSAWCGWWLKNALHVVNSSLNLNLAREWRLWGRPASGPAPGVIGVEPHHVFKVIAVVGRGRVLAISGNDGHAVRTRVRSTRGVIAWREG
jgi:hypothetical protein